MHASSRTLVVRHIRARALRAAGSVFIAAFLLWPAACSDGTAPAGARLAIAAGDQQHALAGTELPDLVVVELRDASGNPLAGVRVTWAATSGATDVVSPLAESTDANGDVSARWQLDSKPGAHTLVVSADVGATTRVSAFADPAPPSSVSAMPIVTYDGSGQAVHPDFVRLPTSWGGDPFRLVATPYPGGNASYENPSLFAGNNGTNWSIPRGVHNPLEKPEGGSYLSDPDMVFDPDANVLRIYYRRVTSENEIWMIRSSNGVAWSVPQLVAHAPNHLIVSPTVVRRSATEWLMWSVNSGTIGCGASSTTVELLRSRDGASWSDPEQVSIHDDDGFAWHIDVEWIASRSEYWAVYPVKRAGGCTTDRLRLATSTDGVHWTTYPSPVLMRGASDWLADVVYRSSIDLDAASGVVSIWYSGAKVSGGDYAWHLAWERTTVPALFARVSVPVASNPSVASTVATSVPQLTNETAP